MQSIYLTEYKKFGIFFSKKEIIKQAKNPVIILVVVSVCPEYSYIEALAVFLSAPVVKFLTNCFPCEFFGAVLLVIMVLWLELEFKRPM